MDYQTEKVIKSILELVRWKNLLIVAISQYAIRWAVVFEYPLQWKDYKFHLMVLSTLLITAAGYIINDYFDVKIDRINKPDKVWIGRVISRRKALLLHQILSVIALIIGYYIDWKVLIINLLSISLLWFYASGFKKKPFIGNFVVAFLTALTIGEVAIVFEPSNKLIYMYAVFALFINLIREIVKDMEDMVGDQMHGAKTLPILLGIYKTKQILYVLLGVFLTSLLFFMYKIEDSKIRAFSLLLLSLWGILVFYIFRSDRKIHYSNISKLCKNIILIGLVSLALFKI